MRFKNVIHNLFNILKQDLEGFIIFVKVMLFSCYTSSILICGMVYLAEVTNWIRLGPWEVITPFAGYWFGFHIFTIIAYYIGNRVYQAIRTA